MLTPDTRETPPKQPLNAPPIPHKALTLSRKVDECKPLTAGSGGGGNLHPGVELYVRLDQFNDTVGRCRLTLSNPS